jgi:Lamin Tail Domain
MSRVGLSVLLAIVVAAALAATAPGAIRIAKIHYNAPGADNSNLNGEWFTITNTGNAARSLAGWRLRDKAGNVYRFGSFTLGAHLTARIHTGSGPTYGLHRYWGKNKQVWNNGKDTATLRNANGAVVDRCSYNAPAKSEKTC